MKRPEGSCGVVEGREASGNEQGNEQCADHGVEIWTASPPSAAGREQSAGATFSGDLAGQEVVETGDLSPGGEFCDENMRQLVSAKRSLEDDTLCSECGGSGVVAWKRLHPKTKEADRGAASAGDEVVGKQDDEMSCRAQLEAAMVRLEKYEKSEAGLRR